MKPHDANSPQDRWSTHTILIDGTKTKAPKPDGQEWSLACGTWDGDPALGIRWDGENGSAGMPQSRGLGVWFILPREAWGIVDQIPDLTLREFAKLFLKMVKKAA